MAAWLSVGVAVTEPAVHSAQVFPQLYLPVMAEANLRAIRPWRQYLPTPSFFAFLWRMSRLNSYIRTLLRTRWHTRHARSHAPKRDILDRLITAIEVRCCSGFSPFQGVLIRYSNIASAHNFHAQYGRGPSRGPGVDMAGLCCSTNGDRQVQCNVMSCNVKH